jgi:nucleoside-diphosphate-sugar epimerase
MKVFLTGATGYIGSAVAKALQGAGHTVTGLARSEEAASRLSAAGVTPIHGELTDGAMVEKAAAEADAVIHTAATNDAGMATADRAAVEAILAGLKGSGKPFIYTSGIWVLGPTGDQIADEEFPPHPAPIVVWRVAVENLVLDAAAEGLRTVVIRPGIVYGGSRGIVAGMIATAKARGVVQYIGDGMNRWPLVEVDDLADLYVLALEKAPAGSVFMGVTGTCPRVEDVALAISRLAGIPGKLQAWPVDEARPVVGPFADALAMDQQVSGARAMRDLGWKPRFTDHLLQLE